MDDDVEITDVSEDDVPFQVKKASLKNQDLTSVNLIGNLKLYTYLVYYCFRFPIKRQLANSYHC